MNNAVERVLGIVAMQPKGEYNSEAYYEKLNIVIYNDSTYMALRSNQGVLPTNTDYWQLIGDINNRIYLVDLNVDNLQTIITNAKKGSIILCDGVDESNRTYIIEKDVTILGGKFILTPRACTSEDYGTKPLFTINNCNVILDNITLEAESYNENPYIYVREGATINDETDSNLILANSSSSNLLIRDCTIKNCMVSYGRNSNIKLINNSAITSMFVFGSTNNVESKGNLIEVQESNLESYYHVYYLDTNSVLKISNDNIKSNSLFFDVIHTGVSSDNGGLNCEMYNSSISGSFRRFHQGTDLTIKLDNCSLYLKNLESIYFPFDIRNSKISFNGYINEDIKIYKLNWNNGKTIGSSGNLYNDDTRQATDLYDIDFKYFSILENGDTMIAYYDSNGTFISGSRSTPRNFTEVPSNAKKYRLSRLNDTNFRFVVW